MAKRASTINFNSRVCYVPITSDRGLCGGINSNIVKEIKSKVQQNPNRQNISIVTIGEKGTSALLRPFPDLVKFAVSDVNTPLNYPTVCSIATQISNAAYNSDKIYIYYNEFKSAINTVIRELEVYNKSSFFETLKYMKLYQQDPDKWTSNPALYELYLSSSLYQAYLNNLASEQSARMTAMENASKNAKELVEKLKLQYNKARQARITMELVEIISGASAV